jgi:hypothetical protein
MCLRGPGGKQEKDQSTAQTLTPPPLLSPASPVMQDLLCFWGALLALSVSQWNMNMWWLISSSITTLWNKTWYVVGGKTCLEYFSRNVISKIISTPKIMVRRRHCEIPVGKFLSMNVLTDRNAILKTMSHFLRLRDSFFMTEKALQ